MDQTWEQLRSSDPRTRRELSREITAYNNIWRQARESSQIILQNREAIIFLKQVGERLNDTLPELLSLHNDIVEILLETESSSDMMSQAQMQSWQIGRAHV